MKNSSLPLRRGAIKPGERRVYYLRKKKCRTVGCWVSLSTSALTVMAATATATPPPHNAQCLIPFQSAHNCHLCRETTERQAEKLLIESEFRLSSGTDWGGLNNSLKFKMKVLDSVASVGGIPGFQSSTICLCPHRKRGEIACPLPFLITAPVSSLRLYFMSSSKPNSLSKPTSPKSIS